MTNKEIIIEIIDSMDLKFGDKRSKINRESLIECWSKYRKGSEYIFYNYSARKTLSTAYTKLFKNIKGKSNKENWKMYILRRNGYKYCSKCEKLSNINDFATDNAVISKVSTNCKTCRNAHNSKYKAINSNKVNENTAKRRAGKLQRTPAWLTKEDQWMFNEIYSLAKLREELTGVKWHVDHKIPLQGELVCGLHVPTNLQVIPAAENLAKGNKYIGD